MILVARHQIAHAAGSWRGGKEQFVDGCMHLGTLLVYSSWVLAVGSAECLSESHRRWEPNSPWPVLVLLGVFLYFSLVAG
jgi:hypothetical protein